MEIEKAFKRLLIKEPFYGLFCLSLPKLVTKDIPTLCVSKQGISCQLNINPDFWAMHTDDEQIALLKHELSHIAFQHMFLSGSFSDPEMFNIAADAEVNSYIESLPKGAVTASLLSTKTGLSLQNGMGTKAYYEALQQKQQAQAQNPQQSCNGGKGGQSSSSMASGATSNGNSDNGNNQTDEKDNNQPSSSKDNSQSQEQPHEEPERANKQYPKGYDDLKPMDSHDTWKDFKNQPEAVKQLMTNNINSILKTTAEQVEKSCGKIPGEFTELIEKLREKKPEVFNWKAYFRRLLGSIYDINVRSTRRKESKRFEGAAGIQHKKKVSILVAVDTSGSVSSDELKDFFSEIDYVYKAGARVTIIECDTRINSITEYDGKRIPEIKGRGGTDFAPPIKYYYDHKKEYATLIYFTDGECTIPSKCPSNMIWVISSYGMRQDYPGRVIYIPKENK